MKKQEMPIAEGKLNEVTITKTRRPNGRLRVQFGYEYCPSRTDVTGAEQTDLNYLVEKYSPNELAQYIVMRGQNRQEINGHDFSRELSLQEAMNEVYRLDKLFSELDPDIKNQFRSTKEFLAFTDNPQNTEKLIKLGLLTKKQSEELKTPLTEPKQTTTNDDPKPPAAGS